MMTPDELNAALQSLARFNLPAELVPVRALLKDLLASSGEPIRFRPESDGYWLIGDRQCKPHRPMIGVLILYATLRSPGGLSLEDVGLSTNSARNALRRAAPWLAEHSPPLAALATRTKIGRGVITCRRSPTDPALIL